MTKRELAPPPRIWVVIDTDPVDRSLKHGYPTRAQPAVAEEDLDYYNPGFLGGEMRAVSYIVDPEWKRKR